MVFLANEKSILEFFTQPALPALSQGANEKSFCGGHSRMVIREGLKINCNLYF